MKDRAEVVVVAIIERGRCFLGSPEDGDEDCGERRTDESEPRIELDISVTSDSNREARFECFSNALFFWICSHFLLRPVGMDQGTAPVSSFASITLAQDSSELSVGVISPCEDGDGEMSREEAVVEMDDRESRVEEGLVEEEGDGDRDFVWRLGRLALFHVSMVALEPVGGEDKLTSGLIGDGKDVATDEGETELALFVVLGFSSAWPKPPR